MKRWLNVILCFGLILMMTACNGGGGAETEAPETTTAFQETTQPETTEPEPTAREVYGQVLNRLEAMDSLVLEVSSLTTTTLGSQSFEEKTTQTIVLQNIGTESFAASMEGTTFWGSYCVEMEELFIDDTLYFSVLPIGLRPRPLYSAEMSAEKYLERLTPLQLIDADRYETVERPSENMLNFADPIEAEEWLRLGAGELIAASGTVYLGEGGALSRMTYEVSYRQGSAQITQNINMKISIPTDAPIQVPEKADQYEQLAEEAIYGPYLTYQAIGMMSQIHSMTSSMTLTGFSAAGGCSIVQQTVMHTYAQEASGLADIQSVVQGIDTQTGQYYYNDVISETYADGIYTYIYGNEIPESYEMAYSDLVGGILSDYYQCIPGSNFAAGYAAGNLGGTILVEVQYAESMHEELCQSVVDMIFSDPDALRAAASAYRTEVATAYIGIDAATGIPTAVGQDFVGVHTIDGQEYELTYSMVADIMVGHESTYEAITGEELPAEDTEEGATPLFYKVTGANGQEMWLLGTMHLGDERTGNLPKEIMDAFAASDSLAVEFDLNAFEEQSANDPELAQQLMQMYFYTDGTTLQEHISDEMMYAYAVKKIQAIGMVDDLSAECKASIWSQYIDNYNASWNYELSGDEGMDMRLLVWAEEQNKPVLDVESGIQQLQMITGFSDGLQEMLLGSSLSITSAEYAAQLDEMYELWCAGDEEALIAYLTAEDDLSELTDEELLLYQEYTKAMETDRNAAMLKVAKQYLESGDVVFYAVGLAHLLAEDGLVNTLRDAGYTVELVPYS